MTDLLAEESSHVLSALVYGDGEPSRVEATLEGFARQTVACPDVVVVAPADGGRNPSLQPGGDYVFQVAAGVVPTPTAVEKCVWALGTRPRVGAALLSESQCAEVVDRPSGHAADGSALTRGEWAGAVLRRRALSEAGGSGPAAFSGVAPAGLLADVAKRGWRAVVLTGDLLRGPDGALQPCAPTPGVASAGSDAPVERRRRGLAGRLAAKLEADGLQDSSHAVRHPLESLLRMLPERMKGERWARWGLPMRPDPWHFEPPLLDVPDPAVSSLTVVRSDADHRLRVLVLHPYLIAGGAESLVLNLLTYIDRERIEMHLITTDPTPGAPGLSPWLARFAEQTDSIFQLHGFLDPEYHLRFVSDFIVSRGIDVVLLSLSIFGYNALPQLRRLHPGVRFVDVIHAEAPYAPMDHIRLAGLHRRLLDRRVVTTESVRAAQVERYGEQSERVSVIPNGIDTAAAFDPAQHPRGAFRTKLGLREGAAIVLFFGRLVDEKQPQHILEVARRLRERGDIVFVLVGAGPERDALHRYTREHALENVFITAPEADIASALADATLTLFPSKREGLPMAGIESLSMGVPVVASRVPGWTDLIDDGVDGVLVEDGDIAGYAEAVRRLIDDRDMRTRMSAAGRRAAVATYDVRACVARWGAFLEQTGART